MSLESHVTVEENAGGAKKSTQRNNGQNSPKFGKRYKFTDSTS